jgi:predicted O-linked N-acetylglucosamine transferase (SPINDLY family)
MSASESSDPAELVEAGRLLHRAGRLEDAERLYAQALAADEDFADAHQLMAVIAGQRGRFDEAIRGFRRAIALEGPTRDRLYNLAEAYRVTGEFQPALEANNQALTLDAGDLDAYRNCAAMAKDAAERARASGDAASANRLRRLAAHYLLGLGHVCLRADHVAAAEQAYRESVGLDAGRAESYNCLGTIALNAHRPIEAETLYRRARELEPKSPLYLNNLGLALRSQLRIDEATDLFRQAIETDPSYAEARLNLEERMLPWLHFRTEPAPRAVLAMHREWGRSAVAHALQEVGAPPAFANPRDPNRPLRIGYVGLYTGSRLMHGFFEPLLANHEAGAVETILYISAGMLDARMKRFRGLAGKWRQAKIGRAKDIIKKIREDGIDIMIDLAGHSSANRLDVFAHKPAPVTVTWLGYPGTTGLPTMDYRITDEVADPPGAEELHTERLHRLRGGSLVYRPPETAPPVAPLTARAPGAVAFGNFDDPRKISPETLQAWGSILRALPEARLILMAPEFADTAFAARIHSDFQAAGIAAGRVELRRAPEERDAHLPLYAAVDISLDTFPFNGAPTTICEALWMGVPVIPLSGDRPWARTSASLLAQVGLERLDSETAEEYKDTAVQLARDPHRLRTLRAGMRERMRVSPLMDERDFARRFEAALREMWRLWCKSPV